MADNMTLYLNNYIFAFIFTSDMDLTDLGVYNMTFNKSYRSSHDS